MAQTSAGPRREVRIWRSLFIMSFLLTAAWFPAAAGHLQLTVVPSDTWIKEPGIRLDFGGDPGGTVGFHTPFVFRFPDGTLRMYYDAFGSGEMRSATSTDGLVWTKEPGTRLAIGALHPHIVQVSTSLFRMYFEAAGFVGVGSATSSDGLTWAVEGGLRVGGGAVDPVVVDLPGGLLRMYYRSGIGTSDILSATSADGLTFAVEAGVRIANAQEFAAVRLPDGTIVLYYAPFSSGYTEIRSARSSNGLTFTLDPGVRLVPGPGGLDGGRILTTSIVQFPGGVVRMYYQGSSSADINNPARVFSAVTGTAACLAHAHGHVSTGSPGHFAGVASPHAHHAQHGTHLAQNTCPPHAFGHTASFGLTPDQGDGLFSASAATEPDFVGAINQEGGTGPARRGTVVQLFGSARELFLDEQDQQSALGFTPPASGSPLYFTTSLPEVRIGGAVARVLFSGLAPGLTGVWQINVLVPEDAPAGKAPVTILYEGQDLRSIDISVQ